MKKSFKHLMASVVASALAIGTLSAVAYAADINDKVDTWGYMNGSVNVVCDSLATAYANAPDKNAITYTVYSKVSGDTDKKDVYYVDGISGVAIDRNTIPYTCTKDGLETYTVWVDGKKFVEDSVVTKAGHTREITEKTIGSTNPDLYKASTCTEKGFYYENTYCVDCGKTYSPVKVVTDVADHVPTTKDPIDLTADNFDPKDNVVVYKAPTCLEDGFKLTGLVCKNCGKAIDNTVKTVKIDMLGNPKDGRHDWELDPESIELGYDSTCEKQGVQIFICKDCHERTAFPTDATGHTPELQKSSIKPATCTSPATHVEWLECAKCHKKLSDEAVVVEKDKPALGHIEGVKKVVSENHPVDCLTKGNYEVITYCGREGCKAEISRVKKDTMVGPHKDKVDKDGKVVVEQVVVVAPTCLKEGSHYDVTRCSVCNEITKYWVNGVSIDATLVADKKTVLITDKALGHAKKLYVDPQTKALVTFVKENVVEATCETNGTYDRVEYCERCNAELSRKKETVDKFDHKKFVDGKQVTAFTVLVYTAKAPTCTTKGAGYYACEICGKIEHNTGSDNGPRTRDIPALGHNWGEEKYEIVEAPTCVKNGVDRTVKYCSRCDAVLIVKGPHQMIAPGHKYVDTVVEGKSDLCKFNVKHYAPTCTENGVVDVLKTCSVCGYKTVVHADEKASKALGHLYPTNEQIREQVAAGVAYIAKEPTCTENGWGHVRCVRCNKDIYDWEKYYEDDEYHGAAVLPAYGHDWQYKAIDNKEGYPVIPAVCEATGSHYEGFVCNRCGAIFAKTVLTDDEKKAGLKAPVKVIDEAIGHSYTEAAAKVVMDKDDPMKGVVEFSCARKTCPKYGTYAVIKEFKFTDADLVVDAASTCTVKGTGHYELKVYADKDDFYLVKSGSVEVPVAAHVSSVPNTVIENEVKATATTEGKFDVVDYCVKCGAEINRITYTVDPTGAVENPYKDIKNNAYYTNAVVELYDRGIMTGTAPEIFGFNKNLERQDLVTLLYRLNGESAVDAANDFADVKAGKYYTNAVIWAKANGIVTGYTKGDKAGQFGVGDKITRQDFVKILYGYAVSEGLDVAVNAADSYLAKADASSVSSYAVESINWGYENGLIGSGSDLRPLETITRQDAATIIARFLNLYNI